MAALLANHVCTWGPIRLWTEPSALELHPFADASQVQSIAYRVCSCGDAVWGSRVESADVLAHLTPTAAKAERRS